MRLLMPIIDHDDRKTLRILRAIPWTVMEPHEEQAQRNHSQTLNRLAERGGLSPCEALAIIEGRSWAEIGSDSAGDELKIIKLIAALD